MLTSIRPCGHHVVVQPVTLKTETESGIVLVVDGGQQEKLEKAGRMLGTLVAVGPQAWVAHSVALERGKEPWAEVGDTVLYSRHSGKFVQDPMTKEEMYVLADDGILAVLPPQEEWNIDVFDLVG